MDFLLTIVRCDWKVLSGKQHGHLHSRCSSGSFARDSLHMLTKACLLESFPTTSMVMLPSVRIVYEPCWYPRGKGLQLCHLAQSPASYLWGGLMVVTSQGPQSLIPGLQPLSPVSAVKRSTPWQTHDWRLPVSELDEFKSSAWVWWSDLLPSPSISNSTPFLPPIHILVCLLHADLKTKFRAFPGIALSLHSTHSHKCMRDYNICSWGGEGGSRGGLQHTSFCVHMPVSSCLKSSYPGTTFSLNPAHPL